MKNKQNNNKDLTINILKNRIVLWGNDNSKEAKNKIKQLERKYYLSGGEHNV